jgi:hypothetical protein
MNARPTCRFTKVVMGHPTVAAEFDQNAKQISMIAYKASKMREYCL